MLSVSKIAADSDLDIILKAYLSNKIEELDENLQLRFKRWETIHELYKEGRITKTSEMVKFLLATYKGKLGRAQAYNDIFDSKSFFGTISQRDHKEYKRGLYIEWLETWAHRSANNGDYTTAEKLIRTAATIAGLDDHSPEMPDMSQVTIFQPVFVYDPSIIMGNRPLPDVDQLRVKYLNKKQRKEFEEGVDDE